MAPAVDTFVEPDRHDLRPYLWPVEHIGDVAACSASAAVSALEYHSHWKGGGAVNLSTLFVHYNARAARGQEGANVGTSVEDALDAITRYGACPESAWPFDAAKLSARPPQSAYDAAQTFASFRKLYPRSLTQSIAMGFPVVTVVQVPARCLTEAGRTGTLPKPSAEEMQRREGLAAHAFTLVAYDKGTRTYVARNCFGPQWGTDGHCTIAFETFDAIVARTANPYWVIVAEQKADVARPVDVSQPAVQADAAPPKPERLSDLAAKLREEIRGDVQRDIADASKRIRDLMSRTPDKK